MTGTLPSRERIAELSALDTPTGNYRGQNRPRLLANLVAIARPHHWFKNILMVPGGALALVLMHDPFPGAFGWLLLALVSTCLIASANYTIDEWLDTEFDRHHPVKKFRPAAAGQIPAPVAYALRTLGPKRGEITPSRSRVSLYLLTSSSIGRVIRLLAKLWAERQGRVDREKGAHGAADADRRGAP